MNSAGNLPLLTVCAALVLAFEVGALFYANRSFIFVMKIWKNNIFSTDYFVCSGTRFVTCNKYIHNITNKFVSYGNNFNELLFKAINYLDFTKF